MAVPDLTPEQVQSIIPAASSIELLDRGGQKIVFTGIINNQKYALKFMSPNPLQINASVAGFFDDVTARAQREVETMRQCDCPNLVKMGPIGLTTAKISGNDILYFSEEFIDGENLKEYHKLHGNFSIPDLIKLAQNISNAINEIWQFAKIHRDIKPGNIMSRSSNGDFILLDMGLVFDLQDSSLSIGPVGTLLYFSPEQLDFTNRRSSLNFRSDLFSLGIVLYEMATGRHPFFDPNTTSLFAFGWNIANMRPVPPKDYRTDLPQSLNDIILRLLAKRPALRYRSIKLLNVALDQI
ncbi:MAG: serine/threonine-protein kinase [Candidatus Hatepunaea meridiana]|nr:serine/threonine-protein kinase [Candidatus Hatepunaea meridiana]